MFLIKIKNTIHGKCILHSSRQGGQTTRFFTKFLYSEKSREKSIRLAKALRIGARGLGFVVMHICKVSLVPLRITRFFFYKEPTSRPRSKSSLFIDLKSANCSTNSSLIVP